MFEEETTELANDRTTLAWTRTALTCILGGAAFAKLGGRGSQDEPDRFSLAVAFFLFASGLWLMWTGWRSSQLERRQLGLPRKRDLAADSSMIIVVVLCVLVTVWAMRLR
jgi:uncharacterized membrane protein YidH (DUF202 family)